MENNPQPHRRFEAIVAHLFETLNFSVDRGACFDRHGTGGQHRTIEVDLLLTLGDVRSVVEIKTYRSRTPRITDLERAALQAINARYAAVADHAFLVINSRRDRLPDSGLLPPGVTLIGIDDLVALAAGNTGILSDLADITRELQSGLADFDANVDLSPAIEPVTMAAFISPSSRMASAAPLPDRGALLAADLLAIEPGKGVRQTLPSGENGVNWGLFEKVGQKSLEYVFEHELANWRAQSAVGGGLQPA